MKLKSSVSDIESDDRALLHYESLRSQVLKKQETLLPEQNRGLALFMRQGMLAWIKICHKCIPESSTFDEQTQTAVAPYEVKSEMIKVLANITLLNLQEAQP
jgi:hypothetical protein